YMARDELLEAIQTRPVIAPLVPDSTHLIEMAKTEWKNREERRGIHNRQDWCCGWMAGFLSMDKPDWSKEHDAAVAEKARKDVLDKLIPWLELKRSNYGCCSGVGIFANDDPEDCDPYDTVLK